jgi:hypothetical protein
MVSHKAGFASKTQPFMFKKCQGSDLASNDCQKVVLKKILARKNRDWQKQCHTIYTNFDHKLRTTLINNHM